MIDENGDDEGESYATYLSLSCCLEGGYGL